MSAIERIDRIIEGFHDSFIRWLCEKRTSRVDLDKQHDLTELLLDDLEHFSSSGLSLLTLCETKLVRKLPEPKIFVAKDVAEKLGQHVAGIPTSDQESLATALNRAFTFLLIEATEGRTVIGEYDGWAHDPEESEGFAQDGEIVEFYEPTDLCSLGESFSLIGVHRMEPETLLGEIEWSYSFRVYLEGGTPAANQLLAKRIKRTMDLLLEGIRLVALKIPPFDPDKARGDDRSRLFYKAKNRSVCNTAATPSLVEALASRENLSAVRTCLEAKLDNRSKKHVADSIERAMRLLEYADDTEQDGIALSLCFSAIEALVCEGKDQLTQQVARRTTALLEPDGHARPDGIKVVKKYYAMRSKFTHGERVDISRNDKLFVRRLAAATMHAIICWLEHERRILGESANDLGRVTSFLEELRRTEEGGQEFVGVGDSFRHCLEENSNPSFRW